MSLSNIYKTLTSLDSQYVSFPAFAEATKIIEENIELYKHTKLAHHLLIFGESGTGKSSICNWVATRYERSSLSDREVIPVLVVSIPAAATISGIVSAMLKSLGDPFPDHGTTTARNSRVVTLCRECRVIAILFDEAQHLHDRGQWATHYMVGDWLKALIDKIAVPTTFLGLPRLEQLLQVNEQLRRRFSRRIWLDLGQDDGAAHVACLQLFSTLAASLPIQVNHSPYS
ncbi:Bacterial TniB protein [compost metagenome]